MDELTLRIVDGPEVGRTISLGAELEIGRDPEAGFALADHMVSRRHARIRAQPGGALLEDLQSTNGTFVNDVEVVAPTFLVPGDEMLIGASLIRLCGDVTAAAAAAVPAATPPAMPAAPLVSLRPAPGGAGPAEYAPPSTFGDAGEEMEEEATIAIDEDPRIGSELAGYRIEALLGRGGMGVVYRAEDLRLGRKVALKLLPPELAENEGFRTRFGRESRLAAAIDHPNIIPLYDAGDTEGLLFISMRFVDGLDLKGLLEREGPLALGRAISIVGQVGAALDAAHGRGLVHRDVKPANVLVASGAGSDTSDHCYLTDFGLTKDTSAAISLTAAGEFVGTIDYVAPEQIQGVTDSGAADQYALGCVFYECLTGRPLFERDTELDVMWAHLNAAPPRASACRSDLPPEIDAVLARALAKEPGDRFPSCVGFATAARATLSERRRHPR